MSGPEGHFRFNLVIGRAIAGLMAAYVALMLLYEGPADGWDGVTLAVCALGAIGGGLTAFFGPWRLQ